MSVKKTPRLRVRIRRRQRLFRKHLVRRTTRSRGALASNLKGSDTWACLGQEIVTGLDYNNRRLTTRLNGNIVQDGNTNELIQDVPELIAYVSRFITLEPGDLIYTGTCYSKKARDERCRWAMYWRLPSRESVASGTPCSYVMTPSLKRLATMYLAIPTH